MNEKPHFYKRFGYWNCRMCGLTGSGWTRNEAWDSFVRHRRWYERFFGQLDEGVPLLQEG